MKKNLIPPRFYKTLLNPLTMVLWFSAAAFAQPANNECVNAIVIPIGADAVLGTTVGATANVSDPAQGCWLTANSTTVWYRFTTAAAGTYTVTTDNGTGDYDTDTQIKLLSGTCGSLVALGCNEDGGTMSNTLAGQVTASLAASTTYFVLVDGYNTTTGEFAINVSFNAPPVNDCILNAIDLSAAANGLGMNGSACGSYYFNPPGNGATDGPTEDRLAGDLNGCNGVDASLNPVTDHRDIWFYVDKTASTPDFWVSAFQDAGSGPNYCMGLYQGTPSGTCGSAGMINGLTYIDCSNGDVAFVPPGNEHGGARDKGVCTTPLHPRLSLDGLPAGRYYIRLWEAFGGAPSEGIVRLCLESSQRSPGVFDVCPALTYTPCTAPNQNYTVTFNGIANVGVGGNSCNSAPNEPQLAGGVPSDFDEGCSGSWVTGIGYVNNVMNNSLIIPFMIDAIGACNARVELLFDNISIEGSRGKVAQIQVMSSPCASGTSSVMNVSTGERCIRLRPSGNGTMAAGLYYIVMDGQDGNLITFDLSITVDYSGLDCSASLCGPLATKSIVANGMRVGEAVKLDWQVIGLEEITTMEVQASHDGGNTFVLMGDVNPVVGGRNTQKEFSWNDEFPQNGLNHYRIVARDAAGSEVYSNVVAVNFGQNEMLVGSLYPNPADRSVASFDNMVKVAIDLPAAGTIQMKVTDLRGATLYQNTVTAHAGRTVTSVPTTGLPAGPVIVSVVSGSMRNDQLLILR